MHYTPSFRVGQYQFSSGIYFLLFTLFSVIVCLLLSVWQWQRGIAANDRYLLQQNSAKNTVMALSNYPEEYQRVVVRGEVESYYLLDNRSKDRRPGREILLEIKLNIENLSYDRILVNIGWQSLEVALKPEHLLPESIAIEGVTKIPKDGFLLQDPLLDPSWPTLLQHVDLRLLSEQLNHKYYPAVVYSLTPVSRWPLSEVNIQNKYHMHLGYALQWALIGFACLLLFIKISISRVSNEH